MYVPGITKPSSQRLYRRKGGGGKGGGAKSGSSGRSGSSDSSGTTGHSNPKSSDVGSTGSAGTRGSSVPVSGATNGRTTAVAYGSGTTRVVTIPEGQPFAGRSSGGATRDAVYGNRYYGSGYPGVTGLGVANRGFPFVFWPLVWGGGLGYGAAYLHDDREYGEPNNTTRPGGPMAQAAFSSNSSTSTSAGPSTFHIVADNSTVASLIASIHANCTVASNSSTAPAPFTGSATDPLPEQAVQYFRASGVALTLDGYNNTDALAGNETTPPPLPSGVDTTLLNCLNATIGEAVPLFADSASGLPMPSMGVVGLVYVIWSVASYF